ncbi:hypothetical protein MUCCIDRAFT_91989 [Mucor lusitanicus CBS 277.49]|uniref:Reverse transcriptase domain-containing protein n=1 Tax=Mucor lusitanicus CBS 277.49 TaxID=747725 RepID=A0A168JW60_MUCCL|nr:hypothetical protein MUCCIDRAFT_91989 [Mucor lusitanicus CBS 277.49]
MEADISNISADEEYLDQDASEEEYLIMEASDDEREPSLPLYGPEEDPTNLLGRLVENMRGQDNINAKDKEDLIKLITEFKDCFGTDYKHMQTTNLLKFHVDTGNHKPIYKTPYGFLSFSEKETLKKDLEDMVANVRDPWPMPNVTDVLESLAGSNWFVCCDLLKAFQQIAVEEASIPKLTIASPWVLILTGACPLGS